LICRSHNPALRKHIATLDIHFCIYKPNTDAANSQCEDGESALWCFTPLSTIFHLYRGYQFYLHRKPEYTDLPEVFTTSGTSVVFVTEIFHSGQPSLGGDRKTCEVHLDMTSGQLCQM
jgi:hypothetical protein